MLLVSLNLLDLKDNILVFIIETAYNTCNIKKQEIKIYKQWNGCRNKVRGDIEPNRG